MKGVLLGLGCLPFVCGGLMDWYMMQNEEARLPFFIIGVLFLVLWSAIAFLMLPHMENTKKTVRWLNAVGFVVLLLLLVQDLVVGAYWTNFLGRWTQYYYLPMLYIGFQLLNGSLIGSYVISYALMVVVSVMGCNWRKIITRPVKKPV